MVTIYESLLVLLRQLVSVQIWILNFPASRQTDHLLGQNNELLVKMSRFQHQSRKNLSVAFIVSQIYFIAVPSLSFPPASSILSAPHVCKMKCRKVANKQHTPCPSPIAWCSSSLSHFAGFPIPGRLKVLLLGVTHFWTTKHDISQPASLQCENDIVCLGFSDETLIGMVYKSLVFT